MVDAYLRSLSVNAVFHHQPIDVRVNTMHMQLQNLPFELATFA
jgi:hypothetical protein